MGGWKDSSLGWVCYKRKDAIASQWLREVWLKPPADGGFANLPPSHWSYSFRDYAQRLAAQVPTAVYSMFNNSNEDYNTIE